MKNIVKSFEDFVLEAKHYNLKETDFVLNDSERKALASVVGVLSKNLNDDEMEEILAPLMKELTPDEIKQLNSLYDTLEDEWTWNEVTSPMIEDDFDLIVKIIEWMDNNDAWSYNNDYELLNILDEINNSRK